MAHENTAPAIFTGRLGIIQRTLPEYRAPFFDTLATICTEGLSLFAGKPLPVETMATTDKLQHCVLYAARNHHFLAPSSALYLCWQEGVTRWLEDWQPDVLILEANPRYLSSNSAIKWMHRLNRPVLGWGLGAPDQPGLQGLIQRVQRGAFLRKLDGMIAYSERGGAEYQAAGISPERIFIAHNAAAARPTVPFIPHDLPPASARPVVLFVGRLQQRKRVDLLLRACAELPQSLQPDLWIVGDGPARVEFESLAKNIYPGARFLGGRFGADLDACFAKADLLVLPGTGGLAIQQAMAHGLPVIAAEADGTQGDLIRPESGWQVPPGNIDALCSTMAAALADLPRLRSMGREAYRIVSEDINLENMVAAFAKAATQIQQSGLR